MYIYIIYIYIHTYVYTYISVYMKLRFIDFDHLGLVSSNILLKSNYNYTNKCYDCIACYRLSEC